MISLIQFDSDAGAGAGDNDGDDELNRQILFVRWESVSADPRLARLVRLDAQDRIIYNVPFAVAVQSFPVARTTVIVADLPAEMVKATARFRQPMPPFAVLLRRVCWRRCFPGPLFADTDLCVDVERCAVCAAALASNPDCMSSAPGADEPMFACKTCASTWHLPCAAAVAARVGVSPPAGLADASQGDNATSFSCPACRASDSDDESLSCGASHSDP